MRLQQVCVLQVDWSWWRFNLARTGKAVQPLRRLNREPAQFSHFQRRSSLTHLLWKMNSRVPSDLQLIYHMVSAAASAACLGLSSARQLPGALGITLHSTQELKLQASLTSSNGRSCVFLQQLRRWIYSRFPGLPQTSQ